MIYVKKTDRSCFEMYDSISMNVDVRSEYRIKRTGRMCGRDHKDSVYVRNKNRRSFMKVIILNGPMGTGKTTVGTCIADKYPGTAFIDGDWCMDIHPFVGNKETKEMAVDNILHMISNYSKCSACNMIVLVWLMDDAWVYEKLTAGDRK